MTLLGLTVTRVWRSQLKTHIFPALVHTLWHVLLFYGEISTYSQCCCFPLSVISQGWSFLRNTTRFWLTVMAWLSKKMAGFSTEGLQLPEKKRRKISSLHVFCHVCIPKQGDGTAEYSCCRCLPSATYLPTQHFSHVITTQWRKESHGLQHAVTKEEKCIQSNIWYWNVRLQNVWARSGLQCQFA